MKKRELPIGQLVPGTKLRVLEHLPSDSKGNQRVLVRCEWIVKGSRCNTVKPRRVTDILRKRITDTDEQEGLPHGSCGCQSKLAHRLYWENRAKGFPRRTQQDVYRGILWHHKSPKKLATRFKLPVNLIATIFRVYAENPRHRRERARRPRRRREC